MAKTRVEGADLKNAHLEGATLTESYLVWADLTGAHLEGAELTGAILARTLFKDTHLQGAKLQEAKDLTWPQLAVAELDSGTTLPDSIWAAMPNDVRAALKGGGAYVNEKAVP